MYIAAQRLKAYILIPCRRSAVACTCEVAYRLHDGANDVHGVASRRDGFDAEQAALVAASVGCVVGRAVESD